MRALTDAALAAKTDEFRRRLGSGADTLGSLLPEAFAAVREASRRVLGMRHFDAQLVGGMVLHEGQIAGEWAGLAGAGRGVRGVRVRRHGGAACRGRR